MGTLPDPLFIFFLIFLHKEPRTAEFAVPDLAIFRSRSTLVERVRFFLMNFPLQHPRVSDHGMSGSIPVAGCFDDSWLFSSCPSFCSCCCPMNDACRFLPQFFVFRFQDLYEHTRTRSGVLQFSSQYANVLVARWQRLRLWSVPTRFDSQLGRGISLYLFCVGPRHSRSGIMGLRCARRLRGSCGFGDIRRTFEVYML